MPTRPRPLEIAARCGIPLALLGVLALAPLLGGFGVLACSIVLWRAAGVWL